MPWVDPADLEAQRPLLLDSEFSRLHLNLWAQSEDRLVSAEDLAAAADLADRPTPRPGVAYVLTLDVGVVNDATVCVVAHAEVVDGEYAALSGFAPNIPHFASGGPILNDGLIYAHAGEHVVPKSGTLVSQGSSPTTVHLHQTVSGDMSGLISLIDARVSHPENVLRISHQIGRRSQQLSGAPGARR